MSLLYRITREEYAESPFDGEGSYRYGGRWSSAGVRIAYASETQALALLEYYVHADFDLAPSDLALAIAELPEEVNIPFLDARKLPANWRNTPAPQALKEYGDRFVRENKLLALGLPSVISPTDHNVLVNPSHPRFAELKIRAVVPYQMDRRLLDRQV